MWETTLAMGMLMWYGMWKKLHMGPWLGHFLLGPMSTSQWEAGHIWGVVWESSPSLKRWSQRPSCTTPSIEEEKPNLHINLSFIWTLSFTWYISIGWWLSTLEEQWLNTYKSFQALHLGSTHFWRFFPSRLSLPHFFDDSFLFFHIAYTFSYLNNFLPHPLSLSNLAFQINKKGHHFLLAFLSGSFLTTHTHTHKRKSNAHKHTN